MPLTRSQRTAFRYSVAARETPRALVVVGVSFVAITVMNAFFGDAMPLSTILLNAVVAILLFSGAAIARAHWFPAQLVPWVAAVCALSMILAGQLQVWRAPDGSSFAYVLLIIVAYSPLTLSWIPAIAVAVPALAGCVIVSRQWPAAEATDWVIAAVAALAIGLVLLGLRLRSVDESGELTARVASLAIRDQLTGLLNRHGIWELVPGITARANRDHEPVFAMFVDVVGLKQANDTHGHDAGDRILRNVADALRESVRGGDLIGRWGGDEFLILGMGSPQDPEAFAQRVREILSRADGESAEPIVISVGTSIATWQPLDVEALIARADRDMYTRRRIARTS